MLARFLKLGFLADFLPQTVLVGFLTGVGLQVAIAVLGEMLGLEVHSNRTAEELFEIIRNLLRVHLPTLGIPLAAAGVIFASHRFTPTVPGPLVAVGGAMAASAAFDFAKHGISVIGPVIGGLPHLGLPDVSWTDARALLPLAGSCFVVIVAQSAATARAYATRHNQQLDENADLVGLSAANAAAAFSGTFVVNGSPTQTAMVESSGGRSQVAHLATAVIVAFVLRFLTGPLKFLRQCVLGAVAFTIAIGLIDLKGLRAIRRESPGEFALALITAAVVVVVGVEEGILLAMIWSLLRIVQHSYHPHTAVLVEDQGGEWHPTPVVAGAVTTHGVVIYRFGAPLFYANANRFLEEVRNLVRGAPSVRWVVVDAGAITNVDYTAARFVRQLNDDLIRRGTGLAFAHVQTYLRADLDRHHLTELIGPERLFDSLHEALAVVHA